MRSKEQLRQAAARFQSREEGTSAMEVMLAAALALVVFGLALLAVFS